MPVEFLTDAQALAYGRFVDTPTRADLERFFFFDDADRKLIGSRRCDHSRLGFGLQLTTVRFLGTFLADPCDVPVDVLDYAASQLGIDDPSCVKRYGERDKTRLEHAWEIKQALGLKDFSEVAGDLEQWLFARSWTTGEGPKALFDGAIGWLRQRQVLLPGVSVLARLVAKVRDEATSQVWRSLSDSLTSGQAAELDALLDVEDGARTCRFDRLRKGPGKPSGPAMIKALERVAEVTGVSGSMIDPGVVPPRRLAELGRYGLTGKTLALKRLRRLCHRRPRHRARRLQPQPAPRQSYRPDKPR